VPVENEFTSFPTGTRGPRLKVLAFAIGKTLHGTKVSLWYWVKVIGTKEFLVKKIKS
jgi:hypothetical protein